MQKTYLKGVLRETRLLLADLAVVVLATYSLILFSNNTGVAAAWEIDEKLNQDQVVLAYENAVLNIASNTSTYESEPVRQEAPLAKIKRVAMETKSKPIQPQVLGIATEAAVVATPAPIIYDTNSNAVILIDKYAGEYGVDSAMMKKIAQCESGMRAEAVNGPYAGIYQFLASTWSSNRSAMGEDINPALRYNLEEAIQTAAFKMSRDGYGAWPACSRI